MKKFLEARWQDLIMVNFDVDPAVLADLVPAATELDLEDGRCYVSLVGFMFLDTRVLGFLIPFHINFEEVNLRFYVKRRVGDEVRRGVVFIKELVPRLAIASVARLLFQEPYATAEMWNKRDGDRFEYGWKVENTTNVIGITRGAPAGIPADGSHASFIIEHYWGYTKLASGNTNEYRVAHPKWDMFEPRDVNIDVDYGKVYGDKFAFLSGTQPYSVLFAAGSEIAVYMGKSIDT